MQFRQYNFDQLNETDIREEIITPLLTELGYRSGTEYNIIREQSLRYPHSQLGRKNPKKDPLLRGKADYICEVVDGPRWTIEAKAPSVNIAIDDIEQAYSYAIHPEVRATYFCVTNGKEFLFFKADQGPSAEPVFQTTYEELNESFTVINNFVGPKALSREHGKAKIDTGKPLGEGLRSIGRISSGFIKYTQSNIPSPAFMEMIMPVKYGSIERNEDDHLLAYIEVLSPFQSMQELNEKLGLDKMEMKSTHSILSSDVDTPTQFESRRSIVLPEGISILDINSWQRVTLPMNVHCVTTTTARGHLKNNRFSGDFQANLFYQSTRLNVDLNGEFEIFIN